MSEYYYLLLVVHNKSYYIRQGLIQITSRRRVRLRASRRCTADSQGRQSEGQNVGAAYIHLIIVLLFILFKKLRRRVG
jgi:hypothetical protein